MLATLFVAFQAAPQVESWAEPFLAAERQLAVGDLTAARQGFGLAPPPQSQGPRVVWRRPAEQVFRVPKDRNTCWIEVYSESETEILGFEVQEGDGTDVFHGEPHVGGTRLRHLVERNGDGSPREVRIQALGPRGSRSAPVHYRIEFESP